MERIFPRNDEDGFPYGTDFPRNDEAYLLDGVVNAAAVGVYVDFDIDVVDVLTLIEDFLDYFPSILTYFFSCHEIVV